MTSLFTALLGGNVAANNQASSTASLLNQNANLASGQIANNNAQLSSEEQLYQQLYSQALSQASGILGSPIANAGSLGAYGNQPRKINPTGPSGATPQTIGSTLKG